MIQLYISVLCSLLLRAAYIFRIVVACEKLQTKLLFFKSKNSLS